MTLTVFDVALDKPQGLLSPETFPLPKLGPVLRDLSKELHSGRGFFVLRTIPVDSYPREDVVSIYAGVSSYVGGLRAVQDGDAGALAHIKDLSKTHPAKAIGAPAYTTDKQVREVRFQSVGFRVLSIITGLPHRCRRHH